MSTQVSNLKTKIIAGFVAAAVVAAPAAPALAWGKDEQNFTKGVLATLMAGAVIRDLNHHARLNEEAQRPTYQPRQPVYYQAQPPVVYQPVQSIYQTPAAMAFNSYSRNERIRIQAMLAKSGDYYGNIDGSFGPGTYQAVTSYASRTGKMAALETRGGAYGLYDQLIN